MRAGVEILDASTGEDVAALKGALSVSMLAGLSSRDFDELAGLGLEHGVTAFAQGGGLGWGGEGGVCVARCLFLLAIERALNEEEDETQLSGVLLFLGEVDRHDYGLVNLL